MEEIPAAKPEADHKNSLFIIIVPISLIIII